MNELLVVKGMSRTPYHGMARADGQSARFRGRASRLLRFACLRHPFEAGTLAMYRRQRVGEILEVATALSRPAIR